MFSGFRTRTQGGFTLLEVLLVVAALAVLAGIVIVAINPGKQLGETRNVQRKVDVNTILNAVHQYAIDTGASPSSISETQTEICKTGAPDCTALIDLSALTANEAYLVAIPEDPTVTSTNGTGYEIYKTANGRITVVAPNAERGASISVRR